MKSPVFMLIEPTEYEIETSILEWLNYHAYCFAFKVETGGFFNIKKGFFQKRKSKFVFPGTPDIIGCYKGIFFAFEVKTKRGKVSGQQVHIHRKIHIAQGESYFVRSLDDAIQCFREIRRRGDMFLDREIEFFSKKKEEQGL